MGRGLDEILGEYLEAAEMQDAIARFKREAQAGGRLMHPGIVGIYEYGEDIAQDIWQKVWQSLPTAFHGGSFRSWLYTIARNCVTDHLRRKKAEAIPEEGNLVDHRHRPADEELAEVELRDALTRCLEKLARSKGRD